MDRICSPSLTATCFPVGSCNCDGQLWQSVVAVHIHALDNVCMLQHTLFDLGSMKIYYSMSINLGNRQFYRSSGAICFAT